MNLKEFYHSAVEAGMGADPRGRAAVERVLAETRERFEEAKGTARDLFDMDSLENPYADTRILWGTGTEDIRSLMVGIDLEVPELLLADRLRERGRSLDLLLTHHPEGTALSALGQVMAMQSEMLTRAGVNVATAEALMDARIREVERGLAPGNHQRSVDAARLLAIPYMCAHTVADNNVACFLDNLFVSAKPSKLKDVIDLLMAEPEYHFAAGVGAGPRIISGDKNRSVGKIMLEMTGGTEGSKDIFAALESAGVSTLVSMHLTEAHFKAAKDHHLNVVIAGHIASDTLGVNLMIDYIERAAGYKFDVIEMSGFRRFPRPLR